MNQPLAERIRPNSLDDLIGQEDLLGPNKPLRRLIEQGSIPSFILYGNPGTGKTTLAKVIARAVEKPFLQFSATNYSSKDLKQLLIQEAEKQKGLLHNPPIIFIDEIHHFNKLQQDILLEAVERGTITLIGATSENPLFEINKALLSRCQIFKLEPLSEQDMIRILEQAIKKDSVLQKRQIVLKETEALLSIASGDARRLLNTFETIINTSLKDPITLTNQLVTETSQTRGFYDKSNTEHHNLISAFIKSIRGSDPNAGVYWLARMLEGGEDPKFIARRLIISASEDIGNANPTALVMANNTFQAVHVIGMPESRIILSQCTIYLATSEKSNACYKAINRAQKTVQETPVYPVPSQLHNSPEPKAINQKKKKDYLYSHDYPKNFVQQDYLPEELNGTMFYEPQENSRELTTRAFLKRLWKGKYPY